jgi:hypothetical protein
VSEAILKGDLLTWLRHLASPFRVSYCPDVRYSGSLKKGATSLSFFVTPPSADPRPLGWSLINFLVPHFQLRGVREHVGVGLPSNFSECANADRADRVQHQESVGIARIPRTIFHVAVQSVSD